MLFTEQIRPITMPPWHSRDCDARHTQYVEARRLPCHIQTEGLQRKCLPLLKQQGEPVPRANGQKRTGFA
jgi:hypothetical protein